MKHDPMFFFRKTLKDHFSGTKDVKVSIMRDDGLEEGHRIAFYFRSVEDFSQIELRSWNECQGRILDLGASVVGSHSLELEKEVLSLML